MAPSKVVLSPSEVNRASNKPVDARKSASIGASSILIAIIRKYLVPAYLAIYNDIQIFGWSTVFLKAVRHLLAPVAGQTLWDRVGGTLTKFQLLMNVEALHSCVGIVPSPLGPMAIQLFIRALSVQTIQYAPELQQDNNIFVWMVVLAWSLGEVVRYSVYGCAVVGWNFKLLTWLRYTLFLVLFPTSAIGELGILYRGITTCKNLTHPNPPFLVRNVVHNLLRVPYGYWLTIVPLFTMGFPQLYCRMLAQRKKVLGGRKNANAGKVNKPGVSQDAGLKEKKKSVRYQLEVKS